MDKELPDYIKDKIASYVYKWPKEIQETMEKDILFGYELGLSEAARYHKEGGGWVSVEDGLPEGMVHGQYRSSKWVLVSNEADSYNISLGMYDYHAKGWFDNIGASPTNDVKFWKYVTPPKSVSAKTKHTDESPQPEHEEEGFDDARTVLFNGLYWVFRERWKNHFTNDECQFRINKLLDEYLASHPLSQQGDAVEMIKWIREEYQPEFADARHWVNILDDHEDPITDAELYQLYTLFKKEK